MINVSLNVHLEDFMTDNGDIYIKILTPIFEGSSSKDKAYKLLQHLAQGQIQYKHNEFNCILFNRGINDIYIELKSKDPVFIVMLEEAIEKGCNIISDMLEEAKRIETISRINEETKK